MTAEQPERRRHWVDDGYSPIRDIACGECRVRCYQDGECPLCRRFWAANGREEVTP